MASRTRIRRTAPAKKHYGEKQATVYSKRLRQRLKIRREK